MVVNGFAIHGKVENNYVAQVYQQNLEILFHGNAW